MRQVSKLVFMVALLVSGMAIASNDLFVRVRSPLLGRVASGLGVGKLGKSLYDVQEGAHALVTDATGVAIPHFYVWVCAEEECLPVDPFLVNK